MKIILATGMYPPDIGGPATYVSALARELHARGHDITVITYIPLHKRMRTMTEPWRVVEVPRPEKMAARFSAYTRALTRHASDADIVYAFSSVSVGVPLRRAKLKKPKKILRLGGDFFWERYTACGGTMGLGAWYASWHWTNLLTRCYMGRLLRSFDRIVFSTDFQRRIYDEHYAHLPPRSVILNAVPPNAAIRHQRHTPFKLLFMGRFVGFKNLPNLLHAIAKIPGVTLTLTGEGPLSLMLVDMASELKLNDRVTFISPVHGDEKDAMIDDHDALIIPSVTEISPNVALEARSRGLPILLSDSTGLQSPMTDGMRVAALRTVDQIVQALKQLIAEYDVAAVRAAAPRIERPWSDVADEHMALFASLV